MFLDVAFLGGKSGVGHIAGVFAQGCHNIAVAFGFKGCSVGLEFYCVRFLLLQLFEKIKTAYLMCFTVYLNAFDSAFPESPFMWFI